MKLHTQTKFGGPDAPPEERGDCFRTCLASLVNVEPEQIPNFGESDTFWEDIYSWLHARGLVLIKWKDIEPRFAGDPPVLLAGGPSPRGKWDHCVLWRDGDLHHDPHPSRAGFDGDANAWEMLMVHDMSKLMEWVRSL